MLAVLSDAYDVYDVLVEDIEGSEQRCALSALSLKLSFFCGIVSDFEDKFFSILSRVYDVVV